MAQCWMGSFWRVLPAVAGLGLVASCRDGEERARGTVLESGYRFTISDYLKAAAEGRGTVVEPFLAAGMQVDAAGPLGETALQLAAGGAHPYLVQHLLQAGAMADRADAAGVTPLMAAAGAGDVISVQALRVAGADPARRDAKGRTALAAAVSAGHAGVVELLVPEQGDSLAGLLQLACAAGHTGVMDGLLKVADRNPAGGGVDWPELLQAASSGGHLPAVRLLSDRMPESAAAEPLRRQLAEAARAAGHGAVADFLEDEVHHRMASGTARALLPPADPVTLPVSAVAASPPGEAPLPAGVLPDSPAEAVSPASPTIQPATAPGRLAGARFAKLNCDAMEDVPKVLQMLAWEPQMWPVVLQDVAPGHGTASILLTESPPRTVSLRVGDEIPGTGCVIEKLRRRRIYTDAKESVLKNVSELHFRRTSTGEVFRASPDEAVLSNDSTARLRIAGSDRAWGAVPGDEFRLGTLLLRVSEIAEAVIVLENRLTRETVRVPLTP